MTPFDTAARALVDGDGRLVSADPVLAQLHARAGGEEGGPLAVPQLAALARLARRLGVPVARAVLAADGADDLDLWVRARPQPDGVALQVASWTRRAPAAPLSRDDDPEAAFDRLRAEADWTWECDAALRLTALSRDGAAALGGTASPAAVGDALPRLLVLEEAPGGPPPLLEALAAGEPFDDQRVAVRAGGARFRLAGVPVSDPAGRLRGFRGGAFALAPASVPDATGAAFARHLDRALRDPLHRIVSTAEAIREQADGPVRSDYEGYAGDIATAGRHLLGLVGDLVDLEAVERDDFQIERVDLDLADVARRAAGLLAVRADDKAMRVERPAEDERLPAAGDFRRVLQVLVNLVGNAVRFGPEGSAVFVAVERRGAAPAVIVADQGRGIPPDQRERAFEKFERLGAREPGSGLGLYISRRLARAMGGDVVVEDSASGARLVLTLPAR